MSAAQPGGGPTTAGGGAGGPDQVTQVSSMPVPPMHYVKLYTDENVKKGVAPRPPPPIQDTYSMFGVSINNDDAIIQSLESQGIRKLLSGKEVDRKKELRKLNHSILLNFLDLIDILIKCPEGSERGKKTEDINLLFINMHHLINEFRPHQARESLRSMLLVKNRLRVECTASFKAELERVKSIVQKALESLPSRPDPDDEEMLTDKEKVERDAREAAANALSSAGDKAACCDNIDRIMCDLISD